MPARMARGVNQYDRSQVVSGSIADATPMSGHIINIRVCLAESREDLVLVLHLNFFMLVRFLAPQESARKW